MLSPPSLSTFTNVTFEPCLLAVVPPMLSPWNMKSSAFTRFGSLHNFPFTNTTFQQKKIKSVIQSSRGTSGRTDPLGVSVIQTKKRQIFLQQQTFGDRPFGCGNLSLVDTVRRTQLSTMV